MTNIYNVDMRAKFTEGLPRRTEGLHGRVFPLPSSKTNDELRHCITQMQTEITEQKEKIQEMKHDCVTLSLANSKLEKRNSFLKEDMHVACVRRDEAIKKLQDSEHYQLDITAENTHLRLEIADLHGQITPLELELYMARRTIGGHEQKISELLAQQAAAQSSSRRHPVEISSEPDNKPPSAY